MTNIQLTHGLLMALLLGTSVASAEEYPAADFQPKVVYQDPSIVAQASSAASAAPASDPCVSQGEKSQVVDSQYPAANFQPKVIFSDTDVKQGS